MQQMTDGVQTGDNQSAGEADFKLVPPTGVAQVFVFVCLFDSEAFLIVVPPLVFAA